jgi:hypothetical protein
MKDLYFFYNTLFQFCVTTFKIRGIKKRSFYRVKNILLLFYPKTLAVVLYLSFQ